MKEFYLEKLYRDYCISYDNTSLHDRVDALLPIKKIFNIIDYTKSDLIFDYYLEYLTLDEFENIYEENLDIINNFINDFI